MTAENSTKAGAPNTGNQPGTGDPDSAPPAQNGPWHTASRAVVVSLALLTIVLCLAWWLDTTRPPAVTIARDLAGERWFSLSLRGRQIGYLRTRGEETATGTWRFRSTTHFVLAPGRPVTIDESLIFSAIPPYRLTEASHRLLRDGLIRSIAVVPAGQPDREIGLTEPAYTATLQRGEEAPTTRTLNWQFRLSDYLSFELWLRNEQPLAGSEKRVPGVDFERLIVQRRTFRVIERNTTGYLVENPAPLAATRIQLDSRFRPIRLKMSGTFDVMPATREEALRPTDVADKVSYLIPVTERLPDPKQIARLEMAISGSDDPDRPPVPSRLVSTANPISRNDGPGGYTGETLDYPIHDPLVAELARNTVSVSTADRHAPDTGLAIALMQKVHQSLTYVEGQQHASVRQALNARTGECVDFAEALTAVARAAGLAARTVFGLAYRDGSPPAFMFHAWNEVYVDGAWLALDPTWNQSRVDATHIPLTNDVAAGLKMATGLGEVTVTPLSIEYFHTEPQ